MPDVVLPVLDEAQAITWVLEHMPGGWHPIVVDNGSRDGSGGIASRLGAEVVVEHRRGFGAACFRGLQTATSAIVCFMDCDGSLDPRELPSVAAPVIAGEADLVLGWRRAAAGAWPLHARAANFALCTELARRTGVRLKDLGPMRAAPRARLVDLALRDRPSGWPLEMVLRAHAAGWRLAEVRSPTGPAAANQKSRAPSGGPCKRYTTWRACCDDLGRPAGASVSLYRKEPGGWIQRPGLPEDPPPRSAALPS